LRCEKVAQVKNPIKDTMTKEINAPMNIGGVASVKITSLVM
jgi:hypothetical protein